MSVAPQPQPMIFALPQQNRAPSRHLPEPCPECGRGGGPYSPGIDTDLDARLQARGIDTLVVTGCETYVCVLGAVLSAVDHGDRVVVVTDALCSSSDEAHNALLTLYRSRYGQQIETVATGTLLQEWKE